MKTINWYNEVSRSLDKIPDCINHYEEEYKKAEYKTLLKANKKDTMGELSQKRADEIFRDINIVVNGFYSMNYLAYWSLRIGGFVAWNGHRKRDNKIPELK